MERDELGKVIQKVMDWTAHRSQPIHQIMTSLSAHDAEQRAAIAEKDAEIARLKEKVVHYDRWLSAGVYYTNEEFFEKVLGPKEQLQAELDRLKEVDTAYYEVGALNDKLKADLDRVLGEAVPVIEAFVELRWKLWQHQADMAGDETSKEECAKHDIYYRNGIEFLSRRARQSHLTQGETSMSEWKQYKRKGLSEMRPYVPGEDLSGVSVNKEDTPELGGMIARNPDNHADQWYVAKAYFEKNLELA